MAGIENQSLMLWNVVDNVAYLAILHVFFFGNSGVTNIVYTASMTEVVYVRIEYVRNRYTICPKSVWNCINIFVGFLLSLKMKYN